MNELISNQKGMTSLEIAEVTGKNHSHVLRDIRNLLEQGAAQTNFGLGSYSDANGQERPCYNLTPKGCLILASGYDVVLREKIINRLEYLETAKRELSRKELALMVVQAEEEKERLALEVQQQQAVIELKDETITKQTEEIKKAAPKVNYYDTHLLSANSLTTTQIAKEIGMDAEKLNIKLKEIGIQYKQSGQWLLKAPYDRWGMHGTRSNTHTSEDGKTYTTVYTVWTQRGRRFIIALYENGWDVKKAVKQIKGEIDSAA
jgi:Rha family phage regulatory protein|nr:MAG TPA: regulatory protein [Caudoviricetes sp.]